MKKKWIWLLLPAALLLLILLHVHSLARLAPSEIGRQVPVLMYHAVGDDCWGEEHLFVRPAELEQQLQYLSENGYALKYNEQLAGQYLAYLRQMAQTFGLENDIRVSTLSRYPEVFMMEEEDTDEKELWTVLEKAVRGACEQFVAARISEGEQLRNDLIAKLDQMNGYVDYIEQRSPEIIAEYRSKLQTKIADLLQDAQIDEGRIATEVTLFADKICVDEEVVRLRSHVKGMKEVLLAGGSMGRKLDFIAQEMNREANTILSKSSDLEISNRAIELKTEIEKVREQIQNIE